MFCRLPEEIDGLQVCFISQVEVWLLPPARDRRRRRCNKSFLPKRSAQEKQRAGGGSITKSLAFTEEFSTTMHRIRDLIVGGGKFIVPLLVGQHENSTESFCRREFRNCHHYKWRWQQQQQCQMGICRWMVESMTAATNQKSGSCWQFRFCFWIMCQRLIIASFCFCFINCLLWVPESWT